MSKHTHGEAGVGVMSEGARGPRRDYTTPLAQRLDVGRTLGGEPDPVVESVINPNDQRGPWGTS